jgi:hypothetical protein
MGLADLGPVAEFVFAVRADPHVIHACGSEHAHVLVCHESITVSTAWHSEFLRSHTDTADTSFADMGVQAAAVLSASPEESKQAQL